MPRQKVSKPATPATGARTTVAPMDELGVTGLQRFGRRSTIQEEFLPQLSGERARKIYREMWDNDPVIGAMGFTMTMLIRQVEWKVEGDDEEQVEFVESCMTDMSHTWGDFIAEALSMVPFGWSWHEVVYKRRLGPGSDPTKRSKYNDGRIGWRKLPIRAQDSLVDWEFDDEGGVRAMVQSAPPDFREIAIPIERSLLFRTGIHKGNPEGRSMLRNAYRPWFFKKRVEEIEGIGAERDLAGLPVIYRSAEVAEKYDTELQKILRNVRRDEQEGLLLPLAYDEKGNKLLTFELLSAAGQRQLDVGAIIDRYSKNIAMTCLADFIFLGMEKVGSFALSSNKTEMFANALGALCQSIADVVNEHGIPRLLAVNGMNLEARPRLKPGDLEVPDLKEIGTFITALAGAGAPLFPDDDLENHLRRIADFPAKKEGPLAPLPPSGAPQSPNLPSGGPQDASEPKGKAPRPTPLPKQP